MAADEEQDEDLIAIAQGETVAAMLVTPGWILLSDIAMKQIKTREEILLRAEHEWPTGAPSQEFLKGVVCGIRLIVTTPAHMVSESTRLRHELQAREQEEQEDNA